VRHIQVILSSVRPSRVGDQLASWIVDVAASVPGLSFELIDLKDWYLPLDDEPHQPKQKRGYLQTHTRAWSDKIAAADGYLFLTPQYNWGYPASLKNALDHLYHEWSGKPAVIVSYGHRGGPKAAEQLRQVLLGLHMAPVPTAPALVISSEIMDGGGRIAHPAAAFAAYEPQLVEAVRELANAGAEH
jgi:NAD(P)H-dependent FMN reductase